MTEENSELALLRLRASML